MSEVTKAVSKAQVKFLYDNLRGQLEATKENSIFIKPSEITNPTTVSSNAASVINAAITKANTNGMHFVVVPAGEYWLTETVYLKSDVILKGCGMDATTLKIADNCDIDAIRVSAPTNNSGIMDLAIDGNRIQNYSTYVNGHHGNAINVWLHYGLIERVRTNWVYKHSLLLNYDTGNSDDGLGFEPEHQNDMGNLNKVLWCDFRDSLLQGVMWGWRTMDSWMCYTNIGSHAANMYLEGGTSRFIGNHFDGDGDNGAGPEYNVYCGDGCNAMVFEGNIFENTQKENIFFRQPSYSNQTMTITIANNIIRTCSKSQNEQYANIKISGYSSSVPATEIVISGNQILNPDTNANHGYAGIHLLYCTNSKVVGNAFFNVGDDEVLLDNTCENVLDDGKMSTELNSKADVANPVFTGSISLGRVADTTVGEKSTATGTLVTASGPNSQAGGYGTTASGSCSSAEGNQTFAVGDYSHSQGYGTRANGDASSVEGNGTVANGANSSVSGMYNVPDSYANWSDWAPNTYYAAGAKVHLPDEEPDDPRGEYFVCNTPHTSGTAWITYSFYWDSDNGKMNYAQIVGNGSNYLQQSNAYTLDWNGNGSYAGDVTINKGTAEEVSVSALKTEINSRYTKPNTGIPATDMAQTVQASLAKADTALQGESVASAVDDWLDENITNPDSPPLDRSLTSSSAAAPADILGGLMAHESYGLEGSDQPTTEYVPVTANETVSSAYVNINGYGNAVYASPSGTDVKIYVVTLGKTYKVKGKGSTTRPLCVVSDSKVTSGTIGTSGNFDCAYGSESSAAEEETEYTALRSGYLYITYSSANCGLWEKVVTPASSRKYYMDDIRNVNLPLIASGLNKSVFREKTDSASALVKQVPRNAESIAKVTSVADSVTLVRSIVGRNLINKNNVGTVVIDAEGTEKTGIQTIHVPAGSYYVILGNVGTYTQVKKVENGIYTNLYKDQFPMKLGITDPSGGYFIVYAGSIEYLGDVSGIMIGLLKDDENTLSFEEYSEKTYIPEALEVNPYIEVTPRGFIEFVNSGNADVSSTVKYLVSGKDDDTTTSKDFMVSPDGTKFLPMVKNDGTMALARVVPKKALFIGNSLTSGWQTFGETATDSEHDFIAYFSGAVEDIESSYTFNRKWATGFEQQTSLANAQSWVTTNIDPLLSSDLDLIVVQLCENVVGNASLSATFPASSLWLMQHLRETCPKARVVWMGLWFERGWTKTLLDNTKKAGCEYIDIRKLYTPENIGYIGLVYKMDSDFTKEYTVDSFVVDDGEITLNFTVDGTEYTATIPSYTSYTSSGDTQISVTGVYHVADTYYAAIHPGNEGFRKIANKMLFDLGISEDEETIPAE